jgi:hypothetical protein
VHLLAVVPAVLLLLLERPGSHWLPDITVGILGADHESDLTRGVGRDTGVGVFGNGEDLTAGLLQTRNQFKVQPLVLGCSEGTEIRMISLSAVKANGSKQ